MKRRQYPRLTEKITFYLTPGEYERMYKRYETTTCRKLSQFIRDVVNNKKVTVLFRNQSADDFLQVAIGLKAELNDLADKFSKTLQTPELPKNQAAALETHLFSLQQTTNEIKARMNQIYELWLQQSPNPSITGRL